MKTFGFGIIILWIVAAIGWVMNIVAIFGALGDSAVTTFFIARCVGVIFAPLGAILGYF